MISLIKQIKIIIYLLITLLILSLVVICIKFVPPGHSRLEDWYYLTGTMVPIITVGLLFFTFLNQQNQLATLLLQIKKNDSKIRSDVIEKRFFLFLQIHRDNVASMTYDGTVLGKRLFVKIVEKFRPIFRRLDKQLNLNSSNDVLIRKLTPVEKIEITYKIIFYGCVGTQAREILKQSLGHFDSLMTDKRRSFTIYLIELCEILSVKESGLQSDLGNYYRHFFHTVTYIHDLKELSKTEKEFYIKRLRGQLSNYEIALLFLNSFSIGRRWRHYDKNDESTQNGEDLIKDYELIKNLPPGFLTGLNIEKEFPNIRYEGRIRGDSVSN